jgi:alanine racemase
MRPDTAHAVPRPATAPAVLTIDLGAIVANWLMLRAKRPCGAVVKADAYGLGAAPVAAALAAAGCRDFFVATPDEALALRAVVPDAAIVVLGGLFAGAEADYAAHGLIPALGSLAELDAWSSHARQANRRLPAWLHFDTGMSRLGLDTRECAVLARDHDRLAGIDLRYVMSHLISAEAPDDPANAVQRDRFVAICARLPPARRSLANSAGIFLGEAFGFDLARPGSALFGVNPTPDRPNPMRAVVSLTARVLAVRDIPAGATVGYNGTWIAARPSRIATVGVGYADGWHRTHSNMGAACFDGHPVPLVGRVSMDLTTFDVTDQPAVQPGGWLELLGPNRAVDDAARDAGTIGYEVLTALGRRYHRDYSPA